MTMLLRGLRRLRAYGPEPFIRWAWGRAQKAELLEFGVRTYLLPRKISHIHGPSRINYAAHELLVACVVRNGEDYVRAFMEHYTHLGVKNFVFLDNGSTDATVELLCEYDNVTVLQTSADFRRYESIMRRYLLQRFSRGRWCLLADIDELFDYPSSKIISLAAFLGYLWENGFNAVVTQMLDMISDAPLRKGRSVGELCLKQEYKYYDISAVERSPYKGAPNTKIAMHFGGIRKTMFGANNGLTKVSLVLMDGKIRPFVRWHHVRNARIADVSCVLLHYPFVNNFYEKVQDAVETGRYGFLTTDEYKLYWRRLQSEGMLQMRADTSRQLTDIDELVQNGFLVTSERYDNYVALACR